MQFRNAKDDSDDDETIEVVRVIGNEMFFYGEISEVTMLEFVQKFKTLEAAVLKMSVDLVGYKPEIRVNICSEGGDLFCGFSAMNVLERSRVKVVTIAQGACCSAATFMLLGGHDRLIAANAHILIHQLSTGMWGKFEELKDEVRSCDKLMAMIRQTYTKKTSIPEKKLNKLLKRDVYLPPSKVLKYRICHSYDS